MALSDIFAPYNIFYTLHLIGLIFGLGGVTATDMLSAYGLHFNPKVLPKVVGMFSTISVMIWIGLFLIIGSGIVLWAISMPDEVYGEKVSSWPYYLKLALTGLATLNGLFLNIIVTPAWEKAVALEDFRTTKEYKKAFKLGFVSGGLSFVCWWAAFFLGVYIFRVLE